MAAPTRPAGYISPSRRRAALGQAFEPGIGEFKFQRLRKISRTSIDQGGSRAGLW